MQKIIQYKRADWHKHVRKPAISYRGIDISDICVHATQGWIASDTARIEVIASNGQRLLGFEGEPITITLYHDIKIELPRGSKQVGVTVQTKAKPLPESGAFKKLRSLYNRKLYESPYEPKRKRRKVRP